jgi:hypothetical protein
VTKVKGKSAEAKTKVKTTANDTKEKLEDTRVEGGVDVKSETKVKAKKD